MLGSRQLLFGILQNIETKIMNSYEQFRAECRREIAELGASDEATTKAREFFAIANQLRYSYHFEWLGRPIIQYPQDVVAIQEIIWGVKPDLIIETGIAHGGSLVLSASMLALIDYCEAVEHGAALDPTVSRRCVVGVDVDIREHNREAICAHPMARNIKMIQGSSVDPLIVKQVRAIAEEYESVLVFLDSNHTHEHVAAELEAYARCVTVGSYCVVFDTIIEDLPKDMFPNRPWGPGNNPKTAVHEYLESHPEFEIDKGIDHKLLISVAPHGYLRRIT